MESEFMKKLKEYEQGQKQEHPIIEELKNIPDDKRVNPPPLEECVPETKEPIAIENKEKSLQRCPTCQKEFKHLARHKCKETKVDRTTIEDGMGGSITTFEKDGRPFEKMEHNEIDREINYVHVEGTPETPPGVITSGNTYQVDLEVIPEPGIELFIDAIELHNSVDTDFSYLIEFLKPVTDAIEKENNVEHWSLIDYGKGCGILTTRLERYIKKEKPAGIVYLDSSTKEGQACKEVLKRHARRVVQGVR